MKTTKELEAVRRECHTRLSYAEQYCANAIKSLSDGDFGHIAPEIQKAITILEHAKLDVDNVLNV